MPRLHPVHARVSLVPPDPSPEKQKEGLVFRATFLVTWGRVKWHKECNYCIPVHVHCTASILDLVLDVIVYNYAFCNLIRALRSGSCDKKSRSEHQTLFLAHAGRGWARDYLFSVSCPWPRSHPAHASSRRRGLASLNGLVNRVKFLGLAHAFATI